MYHIMAIAVVVLGVMAFFMRERSDVLKLKDVGDRLCPACVDGHKTDRHGRVVRCPRCSGHGKVWDHA